MSLDIQIISVVFSYFYGLFAFTLISLFKKIIYSKNHFIKYMGSTIIILCLFIIYFIFLLKISYGYFHLYCLIVLILGGVTQKAIAKAIKK